MQPAPSRAETGLAPGSRRWTPWAAAKRAVEVLREEGLRSLWFKVLGETLYRRLLLVETPLADPPEPLRASIPLEFAFLAPTEAQEHASLRTAGDAAARLARGERCFVARHEGELVSARWLSEGEAFVEYLDVRLALAAGVVYVYETFTRPDYRGRGVSPAAGRELARRLAAEGYRAMVGAVLPENTPILSAYAKAGYRRGGRIGYVKLGRWRRDFVRSPTGSVELS